MKPLSIPVVGLPMFGPQQDDDASLQYLSMPKDMDTYRTPALPDPDALQGLNRAFDVLRQVVQHLAAPPLGKTATAQVQLAGLPPQELDLINQILGEGEASALIDNGEGRPHIRVQEAIFAGVWRLVTVHQGQVIDDVIEIGPVPTLFRDVALQDVRPAPPRWQGPLPPQVQNAPLLIEELEDRIQHPLAGGEAHVVNLSLLPVTPQDIGFLDHHLGTGRLLILSRGYGNCRITNTRRPHCWRVVYYNGSDNVILNTVEVTDMPDVALAAPEDLQDSHSRLQDVLDYLQSTQG